MEHPAPVLDDPQTVLARQRASALRALARIIETDPRLAGSEHAGAHLSVYADNLTELQELAAALGGKRVVVAHPEQELVQVRRHLGAGITIALTTIVQGIEPGECPPVLEHEVGIANCRAVLEGAGR